MLEKQKMQSQLNTLSNIAPYQYILSKTIDIQSNVKNQRLVESLFREETSYVQLGMLFMSAPIRFHDAIVNVFKSIGNVYLVKFIKHCYYNVFTFS